MDDGKTESERSELIKEHLKNMFFNKVTVTWIILLMVEYSIALSGFDFNLPEPFGIFSLHHVFEIPGFILIGYAVVLYYSSTSKMRILYLILFLLGSLSYFVPSGINTIKLFAMFIIAIGPFLIGFCIGQSRLSYSKND
ncbi:MAG TPA: hypothetical protein QGF52_05425 [Nitrososphaerales archaeon]|jgi:hypothetical protein|nr:hypothetical protein [Nitrososphaerales archaeon]|tara:strand:- start:137 stop:553 length:417 start_codon:yes stop_codon:yes gene_type:complete